MGGRNEGRKDSLVGPGLSQRESHQQTLPFFIQAPSKGSASRRGSRPLLSCKPAPAGGKSLPTRARSGDADREGGSGAASPRQVSPLEGIIANFSSQGNGCGAGRGAVPIPPAPRPASPPEPRVRPQHWPPGKAGRGRGSRCRGGARAGIGAGLCLGEGWQHPRQTSGAWRASSLQGCLPGGAGQRCPTRLLAPVLNGEKSNEDAQENISPGI